MSASAAFTNAIVRVVLLCASDTSGGVSCRSATQSLCVQFATVDENKCDGQAVNVMGN